MIDDSTLGVLPNGSHFAIMVFSTAERTELLVSWNHGKNKRLLDNAIANLKYSHFKGDETRTDKALKLANQVNARLRYLNLSLTLTYYLYCDLSGSLVNCLNFFQSRMAIHQCASPFLAEFLSA